MLEISRRSRNSSFVMKEKLDFWNKSEEWGCVRRMCLGDCGVVWMEIFDEEELKLYEFVEGKGFRRLDLE